MISSIAPLKSLKRRVANVLCTAAPYCEAALYDGLLRANWSAPGALRGHAVLGNNFETYVERWSHRRTNDEVGFTFVRVLLCTLVSDSTFSY